MDAVKFFKEYKRMCKAQDTCKECPLKSNSCSFNPVHVYNEDKIIEIVRVVENWSRENPEEVGKKYIIEISRMTPTGKFQVKGTHETFTKAELNFFEEYEGE